MSFRNIPASNQIHSIAIICSTSPKRSRQWDCTIEHRTHLQKVKQRLWLKFKLINQQSINTRTQDGTKHALLFLCQPSTESMRYSSQKSPCSLLSQTISMESVPTCRWIQLRISAEDIIFQLKSPIKIYSIYLITSLLSHHRSWTFADVWDWICKKIHCSNDLILFNL